MSNGKLERNGYDSKGVWEASNIARCDKVDLFFDMHADSFNKQYERVESFFQEVSAKYGGVQINKHVHAMGASKARGTRMYMVETWGKFSEFVLKELPVEWRQHVARLDYRLEVDIDEKKLKGLLGYVEENQTKNRNVALFNSRPREKKEGRNAGGKSVVVGSHASDTRLSVYKRTGERGAIEFHFKGKKLEYIMNAARALQRASDIMPFAMCVHLVMQSEAHNFALECGFDTLQPLVESVLESDENYQEASFHHGIREIKSKLENSTRAERRQITQQLGIEWNDTLPEDYEGLMGQKPE